MKAKASKKEAAIPVELAVDPISAHDREAKEKLEQVTLSRAQRAEQKVRILFEVYDNLMVVLPEVTECLDDAYRANSGSEHLRLAWADMRDVNVLIEGITSRLQAFAAGDTGVRRPQTWFEMHGPR